MGKYITCLLVNVWSWFEKVGRCEEPRTAGARSAELDGWRKLAWKCEWAVVAMRGVSGRRMKITQYRRWGLFDCLRTWIGHGAVDYLKQPSC